MGILAKGKGKKEVVFHIHIHNLEPWPALFPIKGLHVAWTRGSGKSGQTKAAVPQKSAYVFEETIIVPCTLQTVSLSV